MKRISEQELDTSSQVVAAFVRRGEAPSDALLRAVADVEGVELDIDACPNLQKELRIHRVPELLVWVGGRLVARLEGEMTREQVLDWLAHAIART